MAIFSRSKKRKQSSGVYHHDTSFVDGLGFQSAYPVSSSCAYLPQTGWHEVRDLQQLQEFTPLQPVWANGSPTQPQVFVQQNYIVASPVESKQSFSKLSLRSMSNVLARDVPDSVPGARYFNEAVLPWPAPEMLGQVAYGSQSPYMGEMLASKLDEVITMIDCDRFNGDEDVSIPSTALRQSKSSLNLLRDKDRSRGSVNPSSSAVMTSTNYFSKANLYANSKLPRGLPPMKMYLSTFPILCLAAQNSERVYQKPVGSERNSHVEADWRMGTKAMVIKSVPVEDMNLIVFAIRGSQSFMDWTVNLNSSPTSPVGFLDDQGNLCHGGFLSAARKMIQPVATRLRQLLEEDPSRSKCSLLITGHSAGGAVASLLYSHMLSSLPETRSDLTELTKCFKRIHCVTFGAPPVSLLPLKKPRGPTLRKSLFLSFINEGDPVTRADKAYVRSLLNLYAQPAPSQSKSEPGSPQTLPNSPQSCDSSSTSSSRGSKSSKGSKKKSSQSPPTWDVPSCAFSNAGQLIVLRSVGEPSTKSNRKQRLADRMDDGIFAQTVTDEELRGMIWGDPVCHMMKLYQRRIEVLATNAVMGKS